MNEDIGADHEWLRAHRDLLTDALRWQRSDGHDVRMRSEALRRAIRMVEQAAVGTASPDLVPVQREYVKACEAAEAAEIKRLTELNHRAVARHLIAEAQRLWAHDAANIGVALRLTAESLQRAPTSTARTLARELITKLPRPQANFPSTRGASNLCFSRDGRFLAFACGPRVLVRLARGSPTEIRQADTTWASSTRGVASKR